MNTWCLSFYVSNICIWMWNDDIRNFFFFFCRSLVPLQMCWYMATQVHFTAHSHSRRGIWNAFYKQLAVDREPHLTGKRRWLCFATVSSPLRWYYFFFFFFTVLIPEIIMKISLKLLSKTFHNKLKSKYKISGFLWILTY